METIFNLMPIIGLGSFFFLVTLAIQSPVLNSFLIIAPPVLANIYASLQGKNILAVSTQGSVGDRIKFILIFSAPMIIGFLGFLNLRQNQIPTASQARRSAWPLSAPLLVFPLLSSFSVFLLRPVNGVGQSVYVPFFAVVISILGVLLSFWSRVQLAHFIRGAEVYLILLYSFLLANVYLKLINWHVGSIAFLSEQTDGFRYSPFGKLLGLTGRNGFFQNDPQIFAVFSLLSFTVLIQSKNSYLRICGSLLIFIVGSTTQSRIFYIGLVVIAILKLIPYVAPNKVKLLRLVFFIFTIFAYILNLSRQNSNSSTSGISSFSGRTYIWEIALEHWDDNGLVFGNFGSYSLFDFCSEFGCKFLFYHTHNVLLQALWDWGLFGIVVIVGVLILVAWRSLSLPEGGFLLAAVLILAGIIEPAIAVSVLNSLYMFLLILYKYLFDQLKLQIKAE